MKRITNYRKLFDATEETQLAELKTIYRNLMKEWHPDKAAGDEERMAECEHKSKEIIEAYHFLVSISPETHAKNEVEYTQLTDTIAIQDYSYKSQNLKITFADGHIYEYLGVPKNTYLKFHNSPTIGRFARRHIFFSFRYRNISKQTNE